MAKDSEFRWLYSINLRFSWFQDFTQSFRSPDFRIINNDDYDDGSDFFWTSRHLDSCESSVEATRRALALKAVFDGALYLWHEAPLEWDSSIMVPEGFSGTAFGKGIDDRTGATFDASGQFSLSPPFDDNLNIQWDLPLPSSLKSSRAALVTACGFVARNNPDAHGLLQFLGVNGISWVSLYAVFEFLGKADRVVTLANEPKSEISLFTQTANCFAVIGPYARHGKYNMKPPEVPMELSVARSIITKAARNYIASEIEGIHKKR